MFHQCSLSKTGVVCWWLLCDVANGMHTAVIRMHRMVMVIVFFLILFFIGYSSLFWIGYSIAILIYKYFYSVLLESKKSQDFNI